MGLIRTGGMFTNEDFFITYNSNMLKTIGHPNIYNKYKVRSRRDLAKRIFSIALKMAFEDVINGDVEVKMLNTKDVYLRMSIKEGDRLMKSIRRSKENWKRIDLFKVGFRVWYPSFDFETKMIRRKFQLCVQEKYKEIVENKINSGFKYT